MPTNVTSWDLASPSAHLASVSTTITARTLTSRNVQPAAVANQSIIVGAVSSYLQVSPMSSSTSGTQTLSIKGWKLNRRGQYKCIEICTLTVTYSSDLGSDVLGNGTTMYEAISFVKTQGDCKIHDGTGTKTPGMVVVDGNACDLFELYYTASAGTPSVNAHISQVD